MNTTCSSLCRNHSSKISDIHIHRSDFNKNSNSEMFELASDVNLNYGNVYSFFYTRYFKKHLIEFTLIRNYLNKKNVSPNQPYVKLGTIRALRYINKNIFYTKRVA